LGGEPLPPLSGLGEGIRLPNAWDLEDVLLPFRIVDIQLEPGVAVVTFEPLRDQVSMR
jgi:hypothetical protein